jgi:hypothetical protein
MTDLPFSNQSAAIVSKRFRALGFVHFAILGIAAAAGCYSNPGPYVERASLSIDAVRRGAMTRDVSGPGTLAFARASSGGAEHLAGSGRLVALLRVPESQAEELHPGLATTIDLHSTFLNGRVTRTDSSSVAGVRNVEVAILDSLPASAHAGLTLDGVIPLERLSDVLFVARPAFGGPGGTVGMFRVIPNASEAERITVQLGRAGMNTIEITSGVSAGDSLIVSDMSQFDYASRVRIGERGDSRALRAAANAVWARSRATMRGWLR